MVTDYNDNSNKLIRINKAGKQIAKNNEGCNNLLRFAHFLVYFEAGN